MIVETLTSPVILFFVLGFFAAMVKSDLSIPKAFAKAMSIYLMAAIGLKGGATVSDARVCRIVARLRAFFTRASISSKRHATTRWPATVRPRR